MFASVIQTFQITSDCKGWFTECGEVSGQCDYCVSIDPSKGYCCRKGTKWATNGCDGKAGSKRHHQCVAKPGDVTGRQLARFCI